MFDVIIEAIGDTLKIAPVLIILYVLIEFLEAKSAYKLSGSRLLKGRHAPVLGAAAGLVPQCGFSVMATDLYSKRYLSLGTLLAVYIATSDEAVPILLSDTGNFGKLFPLLAIKFVLAVTVGMAADLLIKPKTKEARLPDEIICKKTDKNFHASGHSCGCGCCPETGGKFTKNSDVNNFIIRPLLHALKVLLFILIVNFIFGMVIYFAGENTIAGFLSGTKIFQPFLTAALGLVPNCAASVVITQLFVVDAVNLGSAVAGLTVNAGIATAVLFKLNKNIKENILIIAALYVIGSVTGLIITLI